MFPSDCNFIRNGMVCGCVEYGGKRYVKIFFYCCYSYPLFKKMSHYSNKDSTKKQTKTPNPNPSTKTPNQHPTLQRDRGLLPEMGASYYFQLTVGAMVLKVLKDSLHRVWLCSKDKKCRLGDALVSALSVVSLKVSLKPSQEGLTWAKVQYLQPCIAGSIFKGCIPRLDTENVAWCFQKSWKWERKWDETLKRDLNVFHHLVTLLNLNRISETDKFIFLQSVVSC